MMIFRILFFPFALIYDAVTRLRNHLFNIGYTSSISFQTNVISVGNLSVGGTGKTPMVEYLIDLLKDDYSITTLSRGYGRKTKGFRVANSDDTASSIGDEPFQFYSKFENIHVAVGEERAIAIPEILFQLPGTQVILMDDAYQHRYVNPDLNILLTEFDKPFFNDFVLPAGRLREARKGANRADIVVVTKCPETMTEEDKTFYRKNIAAYRGDVDDVYFSSIEYGEPIAYKNHRLRFKQHVVLFSGIADRTKFKTYLSLKYNLLDDIKFQDHHFYSTKDVERIINVFHRYEDCVLVTTEKDIVKLMNPYIVELLKNAPLFYIPIKTNFMENGANFDSKVVNSLKSNR